MVFSCLNVSMAFLSRCVCLSAVSRLFFFIALPRVCERPQCRTVLKRKCKTFFLLFFFAFAQTKMKFVSASFFFSTLFVPCLLENVLFPPFRCFYSMLKIKGSQGDEFYYQPSTLPTISVLFYGALRTQPTHPQCHCKLGTQGL